jgi:hypothetical protein
MKNLFIQSSVLPEENKDRDIETREKKHAQPKWNSSFAHDTNVQSSRAHMYEKLYGTTNYL